MRKWSFFVIVSLSVCMVGCANKQHNNINGEVNYNNESIELSADKDISEELDENLYVEAEFHMPKEELFAYSSELKHFDYDKVQSILWPNASANKVTTDEFGTR